MRTEEQGDLSGDRLDGQPQPIAGALGGVNVLDLVTHPTIGDLPLIGPPARLSETPATVRTAPPLLGQHTQDILAELGYTDADIAALRACGAI